MRAHPSFEPKSPLITTSIASVRYLIPGKLRSFPPLFPKASQPLPRGPPRWVLAAGSRDLLQGLRKEKQLLQLRHTTDMCSLLRIYSDLAALQSRCFGRCLLLLQLQSKTSSILLRTDVLVRVTPSSSDLPRRTTFSGI
jgi:hypothetical protein